jgi:outer membrane protein with beta-barrel domain
MPMRARIAAALVLWLACAAAQAQVYVGANGGLSHWNVDWNAGNEDRQGVGYRFYAGFDFHRAFGAEVFYLDLGKTTAGPAELKAHGWGLAGVYNLKFGANQASRMIVRLGLSSNKATGNAASGSFAGSKDALRPLIGIGIGQDVAKNVMLRADLDLTSVRTRDGQTGGVQMLSAGVTFRF